MPQLNLEISNLCDSLDSPVDAITACFKAIDASGLFPIQDGELSVVFVDDAKISEIHDDFMGDPTATDVITFPAEPEMDSAGEIILSVDHASNRAAELGEPFSKELALYFFHGWLHLAGFDDRTDDQRSKMREAEKKALALVDWNDPTYHFTLKAQAE